MPFIQLVKKDLRMMKWVSLITLSILVTAVTVSNLNKSFDFGMMVIASTFIFLPVVYILTSLSKDWKTGLFLQMPQPGRTLIAAKLVAMMLIFWGLALFVLAVFGWLNHLPGGVAFFDFETQIVELLKLGLFGLVYSLSGGLLGAVAFLAARLADHTLRSWSGLIGFFTSVLVVYLFTGFTRTKIYSFVFHSLLFPSFSLDSTGETGVGEVKIGTEGVFYTGDVFYTVSILCILFFTSSWLLDKKVEV